ncbi:hypothetical protein HMPREF9477_01041 [Lachnospiraceae bacterium 2_1_46FAA]|nr:hypothetical protein HMPREF9477_01041 [Lachnospiraceae bacterium 2_1_46FAA]
MQKIKELFKSVHTKKGTYSMALTAVVIAIAIVVNMLAGKLPSSAKTIDVSGNQLYEITNTSKKVLKELDKEITFTILAEKKSVDDRIKTFVKKYAALSDKIDVEYVDPVLHPSALDKYDGEENSIVVQCKETERSIVIPFTDIIVYDEMSYYSGTMQEKEFDAEGQLTSAVNYVTSTVNKTVYRLAGHGESTLSTEVSALLGKSNISVNELNLMMKKEIPEDCDLIFIYAPTTDITADEQKTLSAYLKEGGKVLFMSGGADADTPNLKNLLKEYGLQQAEGYIADTERSYQGNYYYLIPNLSVSGKMANDISSETVLLVNSVGFTETTPASENVSVDSFMTTSEKAYAVTEKEQKEGTYILGAVAEDSETKGRLTVIGASTMIDSNLTEMFSNTENLTLFVNAVTSNFDDVENVSVKPKSLEVTYNTVRHAGAFSLLAIFGIPACILIIGASRCWKRRKA